MAEAAVRSQSVTGQFLSDFGKYTGAGIAYVIATLVFIIGIVARDVVQPLLSWLWWPIEFLIRGVFPVLYVVATLVLALLGLVILIMRIWIRFSPRSFYPLLLAIIAPLLLFFWLWAEVSWFAYIVAPTILILAFLGAISVGALIGIVKKWRYY